MTRRRWIAGTAGLALLIGMAIVPPVQKTEAYFTDSEYGAATFTALAIPAPVASCGTLSIGAVRVNWTAVPGATGYVVHYGGNGAQTANVGAGVTYFDLSGILNGGTFQVEAVRNFGSTTWTSTGSNKLNYTLALFLVGVCGLL